MRCTRPPHHQHLQQPLGRRRELEEPGRGLAQVEEALDEVLGTEAALLSELAEQARESAPRALLWSGLDTSGR